MRRATQPPADQPRRSTDGAVDKEAADKFSNGAPDTTPGDMQTGCGCGSCRLIWNTWNLKRAYQAEREMVEKLNSSVAAAQELIYHEQDRAEAAERQRDELREALEEIVCSGSPFDAKGTHSRRIHEIATKALAAMPAREGE